MTSANIKNIGSVISLALEEAKKQGATSAEASCSENTGFSVQVRMDEVESIEYHDDKGLGITVYCGQAQGSASTVDTRPEAIVSSVKAALQIARKTEADPCNGLADKDALAFAYPNLDLFHPWDITPDQAIELALNCEREARRDTRISNSEGASVSTQQSIFAYGNTHGFIGAYDSTQHQMSCSLLANYGDDMQRDYAYTVACDPTALVAGKMLAEEASRKTLARLNSRSLPTCRVPVILAAEVARGFIGHFVSAMSGGAIYRDSSFLCGKRDQIIFPEWMTISEAPHLLKALGSQPFDSEGVATRPNIFVEEGRFINYALSSYSARKLNLKTSGNAGGVHNLSVPIGEDDLPALLKKMGRGIFITELMGQGINIMTGDYSRGASGFWVEQGEIQYPVHQITIASTLQEMFKGIVAISNDVDYRGNVRTGSILLNEMTVAGGTE
jgi:PmbA protein